MNTLCANCGSYINIGETYCSMCKPKREWAEPHCPNCGLKFGHIPHDHTPPSTNTVDKGEVIKAILQWLSELRFEYCGLETELQLLNKMRTDIRAIENYLNNYNPLEDNPIFKLLRDK